MSVPLAFNRALPPQSASAAVPALTPKQIDAISLKVVEKAFEVFVKSGSKYRESKDDVEFGIFIKEKNGILPIFIARSKLLADNGVEVDVEGMISRLGSKRQLFDMLHKRVVEIFDNLKDQNYTPILRSERQFAIDLVKETEKVKKTTDSKFLKRACLGAVAAIKI